MGCEPWTVDCVNRPQTTAHLIEPQTFFSPVSGEKEDNQNILFDYPQ